MSFYEHKDEWGGFRVRDYEPGATWAADEIPRLRVDFEADSSAADMLQELLQSGQAERLAGVVIGAWSGEMYDAAPSEVIETLVAAADQLPNLKAIFLGDVISEENEISWMHQTDVSALWAAFPQLESFGARGGNGLSLGRLRHNHLKKLVIETGGLPKSVLAELAAAHLPALTHLELYLGDTNYGWDGAAADLAPLLDGALFPQLKYLGIRNAEIADEAAALLAKSPLLGRLEELDLSLGTFGDEGAEALLASPNLSKLKRLNLEHSFLDEAVMERLKKAVPDVNLSDAQGGDSERYVSIGE